MDLDRDDRTPPLAKIKEWVDNNNLHRRLNCAGWLQVHMVGVWKLELQVVDV